MKKYFILVILLLIIQIPNIVFSSDLSKIVLNGQEIKATGTSNDSQIVCIPVRSVFESLGAQVIWEPSNHSILITKDLNKIWLQIDSQYARIGDQEILLEAPVKLSNSIAVIPLTFLAKALPVKVEVDVKSNIINISDFSRGILLTANSHILVEPKSGLILLDHNSHDRVKTGNLNKVMNMLLIFEAFENNQLSLEDIVTASDQAAKTGGSQIFLKPGEKQSVEVLIRSMAMIGANDAAVDIAEYMAGSEQAFVDLMNKKAEDLGLKDTHFVNVTGLDAEDQFTSAYDLAVITRELTLKYPKVLEFSSMRSFMFKKSGQSSEVPFNLANSNKLLGLYEGVTGFKTAYSSEAGYCIIGTAERPEIQLLAVVLGAFNSEVRYDETKALLDYGFGDYNVLIGKQR